MQVNVTITRPEVQPEPTEAFKRAMFALIDEYERVKKEKAEKEKKTGTA